MDSWTDKQLDLMKAGGNANCNSYLKQRGIDSRTPIKAKYESDVAQLYKEILKARVEGRPEPTELPKKAPSSRGDSSGMERLAGESDQQYIARQTRLREEARVRMASKFGNTGGKMGGVGSGGSMQGIGSNSNYNPNGGYGGGLDLDGVVSGFGAALGSVGSIVGSAANSVNTMVQDQNLASSVTNAGGSFWSSLSTGVASVTSTLTQPDGDDGLSSLQREFSSNRPAQSKYGGFGSDAMSFGVGSSSSSMGNTWNQPSTNSMAGAPAPMGESSIQEASGLTGEDVNGIGRLTGESEEQYVMRQTRLRDEAKARMAAKFGGGGGMSSASSNNPTPPPSSGFFAPFFGGPSIEEASGMPGEDRNGIGKLTGESEEQYVMRQTRLRDEAKARMAAKFGGGGMSSASSTSHNPTPSPSSASFAPAPSSGNFSTPGGGMQMRSAPTSGNMTSTTPPPRKNSKDSSDDFFSSFGS
jgi:ADP-ribosylation factor GTPase-activating protein 1